jgi:pyruvate formate lyase activating enzyme
MEIKGAVDLSLVDWDGKICSVLFLPRCNFRCPFCQNSTLVLYPESEETIPWKRIESYLHKNKNWIEGVCITGGEPTLSPDLPALCAKLKEMGLAVKIDTNGTNPEMINQLTAEKLVDYIALDIKAPFSVEKYSKVAGINMERLLSKVKKTRKLLMSLPLDYEFRTTVVPTLHTPEDVKAICREIVGCKKYVIQRFRPGNTINPAYSKLKPFLDHELKEFLATARKLLPSVTIR